MRHFLCCKKSLVQSTKVQYCNIEERALSMDSRKTSVALGNIDGRILISTNNKVQINKLTKPSQFVPILISKKIQFSFRQFCNPTELGYDFVWVFMATDDCCLQCFFPLTGFNTEIRERCDTLVV